MSRTGVFLRARPLWRSPAAARSVRVLASFRNSWRAKAFLILWISAAVWVWRELAGLDLNLLLSVVIGIGGLQSVIGSMEGGAGPKVRRLLTNRLGRLCFLVGAATAFIYASVVAGDWGPAGLIPYAYFGRLHLHHWAWSLGQLAALLDVLRCESPGSCQAVARRTLVLGTLLAALAAACLVAPGVFPGNRSFRVVMGVNASLLGMLSLLLRSREFSERWAGLFVSISLGVLLGILGNGLTGIFRDFVQGRGVPPGLIFLGQEVPVD